jgi:hypothetical protein
MPVEWITTTEASHLSGLNFRAHPSESEPSNTCESTL